MSMIRLSALVPLSIAVTMLSLIAAREALVGGDVRFVGLSLGAAFLLLGIELYILRYDLLDELVEDILEKRERVGLIPSEKGSIKGATLFAFTALAVSSLALLLRYISGG